jgi:hypothetical protein
MTLRLLVRRGPNGLVPGLFQVPYPVSGLKKERINGWYNHRLENTIKVHHKNIRYILNMGGRDKIIFSSLVMPSFLNR